MEQDKKELDIKTIARQLKARIALERAFGMTFVPRADAVTEPVKPDDEVTHE